MHPWLMFCSRVCVCVCSGASGGSSHCLPDIIYGEESDKVSCTPLTHNIHAFVVLFR